MGQVTIPYRMKEPTVTMDTGDDEFRSDYPQLSTAYFNPARKLSVWGLNRLFQTGGLFKGTYVDYSDILLNAGYFLFLASNWIHVNEVFHLKMKCPDSFRIVVTEKIGHIGNSSYTYVRSLVDKDTNEQLAYTVGIAVVIDGVTRKPTSLPEWFREKMHVSEVGLPGGFPLKRTMSEKPPLTFKYSVKVAPSHTDRNQHVNQAFLVSYVFDAAWLACNEGFFPDFSTDLHEMYIKDQKCLYKAEARLREVLTVDVWSPDSFSGSTGHIYGSIANEKSEICFQIILCFHAGLIKSKC